MRKTNLPSVDALRRYLDYDPDTGTLIWKERFGTRGSPAVVGERAGTKRPDGYRQVRVCGVMIRETHVIWCWVTGEYPAVEVDHENTVPDDNRWLNLRLATSSQQKANTNRRKDNTSGHKGVSFVKKTGKWTARVNSGGKLRFCKCFDSKDEAIEAQREAAKRLHGEFARA